LFVNCIQQNGVDVLSPKTGRTCTKARVCNSEDKYRLIVENIQEAIVVAQEGQIKFCNSKSFELLGYAIDEFRNKELTTELTKFIHPQDRGLVLERHNKRLQGESVPEIYDFRIVDRGGHIKWVEISTVVIDWDGRPAVLNFLNDITYRKNIEQETIRLETAIEQAGECVVITDANATIQYVNPAFEKITGYARAEVIGQNPRILQSGRHDGSFYTSMWKTLISGDVWSGHFVNHRKDGSLYEEDVTISPVKNAQGKITNYVAVKRDVTEEIKKEKQLRQAQKMEAIGTLAGGIAHDFNNILSAIIGYSEMALDKVENDASLQIYMQEIFTAGVRARDLVKQILTFSRQAEQEMKPVQIKFIVEEILRLLRASLPATIEILRNIQSADTVLADPTQIHQILMNLCTNAAQAMREKGGLLNVSLITVEMDEKFAAEHPDAGIGPYLRLTVRDTGLGIAPEIREKIFDPFFTTKEKEEGTGMGLAVVDGIVKGHGGFITVESKPQKGTAFHVYLPVARKCTQPEIELKGPLPTGSEHILLIDDEKPLVDIGREMLKRQGYEITTCTSSVEALALFKAKADRFDLVITDMTMPDMTGIDLAREFLAMRPDFPIILCTGFSETVTEETARSAGVKAFLLKPLTIHELTRTIRKVLDHGIVDG